ILLRTQKSANLCFFRSQRVLNCSLMHFRYPARLPTECPYYFWNGHTAKRAVVGIAERALAAVFKKSCVKNAHAHRYRHTLATWLLGQGYTFELVADILGNSVAVVKKHYGKWSKGWQTKSTGP